MSGNRNFLDNITIAACTFNNAQQVSGKTNVVGIARTGAGVYVATLSQPARLGDRVVSNAIPGPGGEHVNMTCAPNPANLFQILIFMWDIVGIAAIDSGGTFEVRRNALDGLTQAFT